MHLVQKFQIRPAAKVAIIGRPPHIDALPMDGADPAGTADAVIVFVTDTAALQELAAPAWEAARDDRLAWICYPKNKQLGTDLNRDTLAASASEHGARAVRQIAIDPTWSALRFRPL